MDRNDTVMVSVICLVYNHEKFLKNTLDGFIMQKTDFNFEVIVHEDASTDHSADIIREYEKKYPMIIKPIYQTENQYSKKVGIVKNFIFPKTCGKYLAWCEGDDYWTDENKLQRQVDALENNPNCSACITKVESVTLQGKKTGKYFPVISIDTGVIPSDTFVKYCLVNGFPLQISGFMMKRDIYHEYLEHPPEYRKYFEVGDIPTFLYAGLKGDAFYIDQVMSSYRTGNSESWVGRVRQNNLTRAEYFLRKAKAYEAFDTYTNGKYHDSARIAIGKSKMRSYLHSNDVKKLKSEDMREFYNMLSFRTKVKVHLLHYFPRCRKYLK